MLGKIEGRRRGWQRTRSLDGIIDSMAMSLSELQGIVKDREAWHTAVPWGHKESDTTEQLNNNNNQNSVCSWKTITPISPQNVLCLNTVRSELICLCLLSKVLSSLYNFTMPLIQSLQPANTPTFLVSHTALPTQHTGRRSEKWAEPILPFHSPLLCFMLAIAHITISEVNVTQLCPTLCDFMDCIIFQARIL